MTKEQLAEELWRRQSLVEREVFTLTDDAIIDGYITCSDCGERQMSDAQLARAIRAANNSGEFLAICRWLGTHHG
jgi:hypothetical protein